MMKISSTEKDLENDVGEDDLEGVEQVDQEPDLHRLDTGRAGQAGGHREVDGGQDHHAGDVDGVDHVVLGVTGDVVRGLVDEVHEDGREVGDEGNAGESPGLSQLSLIDNIPQAVDGCRSFVTKSPARLWRRPSPAGR